jgi:hypothetical protein
MELDDKDLLGEATLAKLSGRRRPGADPKPLIEAAVKKY